MSNTVSEEKLYETHQIVFFNVKTKKKRSDCGIIWTQQTNSRFLTLDETLVFCGVILAKHSAFIRRKTGL